MKLAAALYLTSKLIGWIGTFAIFSLWLEVNSAGDRVIRRAVGHVWGFFSRAFDYFIELLLQVMA
jgi:hypothetical protein